MYSSYSPLQRTQLSGQVYTDTQSLYLLVYAPGRRVALENTLRDQLHQKFRLVDSLADALTPAVAGVLLVREDVELMSTALNYFAAALKDGADLVLSDAVFGYNGARWCPALCWTAAAPPQRTRRASANCWTLPPA